MRRDHLSYLVCPDCKQDLQIASSDAEASGRIESGTLRCTACGKEYPILRGIPRFVPAENYARGFGFQWNKHARTQYDSTSGSKLSETRFFEETKWPRQLQGQTILEVGSGSGRFTEHACSTGAMVVTLDLSSAVEANYASNGNKDNVLILQADVYRLPLRPGTFDKLFCFGVLQYTPDPRRTVLALAQYLRDGGQLAVDVYRRHFWLRQMFITRHWVRPFTRNMEPEKLYQLVDQYVRFMWPVTGLINKLPYGKTFNWQLLVADYRGVHPLPDETLREWAVLDTFDILNPTYEFPQTAETLRKWLSEAGFEGIDVHPGYNGIEARAQKKMSSQPAAKSLIAS
jgi:SAM-dependent methyltransferase